MMKRWIVAGGLRALLGVALSMAVMGTAQAQGGNAPIDSDLAKPATAQRTTLPAASDAATSTVTTPSSAVPVAAENDSTYRQDDLIGAAEGAFGKGAKGVAQVIQSILKKQGQPNGYVVGREAGAAFMLGLRYGSGTLHHKIEGNRPVYWTGPSLGFDGGGNASSTFMLVYNLYNTDDLYHRFGAGEGQAYFVGGFNVSYLRRGDMVLIPVRLGVGLRLGVNAGYMKFSKKQNWFPL